MIPDPELASFVAARRMALGYVAHCGFCGKVMHDCTCGTGQAGALNSALAQMPAQAAGAAQALREIAERSAVSLPSAPVEETRAPLLNDWCFEHGQCRAYCRH